MVERANTWSLRGRLTLIAVLAMAAALGFGGLAMYWASSIEGDQMTDAHLEHLGATVAALVEHEYKELHMGGAVELPHLTTRASGSMLYRFQVWSRHGTLLMRSRESPADRPLTDLKHLGFANVRIAGEDYRAFSLPSHHGEFIVEVAVNKDERWAQTGLVTAYYVGFLLIPFGVVLGSSWLMMRRSLRSVDSMSEQLGHRNPLDLTPIRVEDPPAEMLPVLRSIDTLFDRVSLALSAEKRFTSMAAHEMRTPLAGLRAHCQLASKAHSEADLQKALTAMQVGVDRASHMLDQLLDLARIEALPTGDTLGLEPVNLAEIYQDVMVELRPKAARKQIVLNAQFRIEALRAHHFALSVLMRNLIVNAILYSPPGGRVDVLCEPLEGALALCVDDSGPGIREADRERVFERFNRLGRTRADGVGLGLSIVLSVVELHRARIRVHDSPLGGLRVQVLFAPASD